MIGRLALRSLTAHPVRSLVLAAGFGVGVAVMAILLGVAQVVLRQAQSPALVGGGDVLIRLNPQVPARLLLDGTLQSDALRPRVATAAPFHATDLFLLRPDGAQRVAARGGIPSLEQSLGDPETAAAEGWRDGPDDTAWRQASPADLLARVDRFHPIPDAPRWAGSWAEWLYFNGRAGDTRFYLTFLAGPRTADGRRGAGVRLQLERAGVMENYAAGATLTEAEVMQAPNLTIGGNSVRLDGMTYRIRLDLRDAKGRAVRGELALEASAGRLVPPVEVNGAGHWTTGYVVPVMSGALRGALDVDGRAVTLRDAVGYHDHNWGFWEGVSWRWGQVQHGALSVLYGRIFPPAEAADADRIPGLVAVLGPDGPLGFSTSVRITEVDAAPGAPQTIRIRARGVALDLDVRFEARARVVTRMTQGPLATGLDFLQLRGDYTVTGTAGGTSLQFTAPGSAETFRSEAAPPTPAR